LALLDLKVSIREGSDGHWGWMGVSGVQVPVILPVIEPVTEPVYEEDIKHIFLREIKTFFLLWIYAFR